MNIIDYEPIARDFSGYRSGAVTDVFLGLSVVADELQPLDGKFVLDYGCGDGSFCRMLRNCGAWVTGVDVAPSMIEQAKAYDADGINYMQCEPSHVELADRSVDAVTFNFVLQGMPTREGILDTLREAHRLLKEGGTLAILSINWEIANGLEFLTFRLHQYADLVSGMKVGGILKGEKPIEVHDYYWSKDDYRAMLREAGFVVTKTLEPLATDDRHPWISEKSTPPFAIFVATKVSPRV